MRIVNMSSGPEQVKLVSETGVVDYINVMPKKQVQIPEGFVIDSNWAVTHPQVRVIKEA